MVAPKVMGAIFSFAGADIVTRIVSLQAGGFVCAASRIQVWRAKWRARSGGLFGGRTEGLQMRWSTFERPARCDVVGELQQESHDHDSDSAGSQLMCRQLISGRRLAAIAWGGARGGRSTGNGDDCRGRRDESRPQQLEWAEQVRLKTVSGGCGARRER